MNHIIGDIPGSSGTFSTGGNKCRYGCAPGSCDGTVIGGPAAAAAAPAPVGTVTYEVTYDTYGQDGPIPQTITVTANNLELGGEFVTLWRSDEVVFSVHRDRFATIRRVEDKPAAAETAVRYVLRPDNEALDIITDRVAERLARRINTAVLGRDR